MILTIGFELHYCLRLTFGLFLAFYHGMLNIFTTTIYSQQLHLYLIYIDMYQDGMNYSQVHLYQNTSNMRPILRVDKYVDGRGPRG